MKVLIAAVLLGSLSCGRAGGDTITLKSSVRLPPEAASVKLCHIARIEGRDAEQYAQLTVVQLAPGHAVLEIPLRDVRARLDEAAAHWGKIQLCGRSVIIRRARPDEAAAPLAMTPLSINDQENHDITASRREFVVASSIVSEASVRGAIASMIAANLNVAPADVRLEFDEKDRGLLGSSTIGQRYDIQPLSSWRSDRLAFSIRAWSGASLSHATTVTVMPELRAHAAILRRAVAKDHTISDADLELAEQWLPPSQAQDIVHKIAAIDRAATKSLNAGTILRERDLRQQTLIKRGDLVTVRCLVGGVAIALQAEARQDGGAGDQIEFRKQGERETFLATVTRRSEAILDLSRQ